MLRGRMDGVVYRMVVTILKLFDITGVPVLLGHFALC